MAKKKTIRAEELFDDLQELTDGEVFLLSDATIHGAEGLVGLRLIACALHESVHGPDDDGDVDPPSPEAAEARALVAAARRGGVDFIVCYRVRGGTSWELGWSSERSHEDAVSELLEVVRHGLLLDPVDW